MIKIAFQGERGAFSEDAAYHFFHKNVNPQPYRKFRNVFESVKTGHCDFGVVPIENTFTGSIHQNVDLLLEFDLSIVGEVILRIKHNLLGIKGSNLKDIKKIYSHPQALEQSSFFLDKLEGVDIIPMYDTAGSAKLVAEKHIKQLASVASLRACKDYRLKVLKEGIESNHQNYTRFVVIAPDAKQLKNGGKTSIVFTTKDIPGALFKALGVFALRDINLLKIESRPLRKGPWKYYFYLDFEGSIAAEPCRNAIRHLGEITIFLRILGSYEKGKVFD